MWAAVLTRLEVVIALIVVAGAGKSAYNGTVRGLIQNIREIPGISDRVDEMSEKQEQMVDGMVALSIAESKDDATVDTAKLAEDLRDGASYRVYLNRDKPKSPYSDIEDEEVEVPEEERRWREQDDD